MKVKVLTSIVVILTIILSIAIGLLIYIYTDDADILYKKTNPDKFLSEWQQYISDDTTLNNMVIPGTHDAGCNNMMPLARTQGHDIIEQLNGGARYLDLRVTSKADDLVIFHGPIKGQRFSKVLNEINTFITANPSEFLILDFQHLGKNVNSKVLDMITSTLPMNKAMIKSKFANIEDTTMKDIRDNNINFVIIWNNEIESKNADYLYYRDTNLFSFYDSKFHRKQDVKELINHFQTYYDRYENKGFFVLQSQRTAPMLIDKPSHIEIEAKHLFNQYLIDLKSSENLAKTNIVMRDFLVSDLDTVKLILSLNLDKNNVKSEFIDLFSTKIQVA